MCGGSIVAAMARVGIALLCAAMAGCASPAGQSANGPAQTQTAPSASGCPALAQPPAGQCRSNADCHGQWVECQWGTPPLRPRATGSGRLFGTDDAACEHGYQQETPCPAGQAFRTRPAANLCPIPECIPRCTATSCSSGDACDQGTGLCQPISCTHGWSCAGDEICQHGSNADPHGCAPRCPGYGRCVVYGPPSP